ncbi:MAG: SPOR domain-containing protein [Pseudomonadota bacterium]
MTEAAEAVVAPAKPKPRPAGPPTPVAWLMGLSTAIMTVGVVYWGVDLAQRDPASLPVIKAPDGIARLEPTKPGGASEDFQGLAVNSVQSNSEIDDGAPQVIALAPSPMGLEQEDIPALTDADEGAVEPVRVEVAELGADLTPEPQPQAPAPTQTVSLTGEQATMPVTAEEVEQAIAEALRLATEAAGGEAPTEENTEVAANTADTPTASDDANASPYAVKASAVPTLRPARPKAPEPTATVKATPETPSAEAAPETTAAVTPGVPVGGTEVASIEAGTRVVQLGAFDSRATARNMWKTLQNRNTDLLAGRSYFIQPVESGGKTLFRLRVLGFETTTDARNMCAALTQRKIPCIAVIQR